MKKKETISEASTLAAALGRLARGVPKNVSQAERKRRAERLAKVRARRWPAKTKKATAP